MIREVVVAVRQLTRQPGLSAAAILTLGLGLGASLAVFTLVNAVLLRPLPYADPDDLVFIGRAQDGPEPGSSAHRDVAFLRDHVKGCGPIAASVSGSGMNVAIGDRVSYQDDRLVSRGYFDALGIQPTWGRAFTTEEDSDVPARVVILNERFLQRQRLDPSTVVGREIQLGGETYSVVGVLSARQTRPSDADIYRPLGRDRRGGGQNLNVVCRLRQGTTLAALAGELDALTEEARRAKLAGAQSTRAYTALSLHEYEYGRLRPRLMTLLTAVALVLLVAAANTTGLLLVRAAGRRREIAVRTALGAAPRRIAASLVIEGLVLSAAAGGLGLAASPLLIQGLLAVAPAYYVDLATFSIDASVILAACALCAVVGLAVAVPPLLEVIRVNLRDSLQDEGRGSTGGRRTIWMRHLLVGAETAVCAVLLVGALLLLRTFINLISVPTGTDPKGVVTARMSIQGPQYDDSERLIRFFEDGVARLEQLPGIEAAAVGASLPAERALNLFATFPDMPGDKGRVVNWRYVTPRYFALLSMRHIAGRSLTDADRAGAPKVAVVNEAFAAQLYGNPERAMGRRVSIREQPPVEIVGVVGNTSGWTLGDAPRPMVFVPAAQVDAGTFRTAHAFFPPRWIIRTSLDVESARKQLEGVMRELDPSQPFIEVLSLESLMQRSIAMERFYMAVLLAFAVFAVGLAAVGIYAAYSYAVASRTQEIGVRLALGAAPRRILAGIVGQSLLLGSIAIGAGLVAAAAASRVLRSMLYDVRETDPLTYATVGLTLLATIVAATLVPAIRAARVDPLTAIRR